MKTVFFFLFLLQASFVKAQVTFQKLITASNKQIWGYSICSTPNNTFAITGKVVDYNDNLLKLYVLMIDENGDTLWTKVLKDTTDIYGSNIIFSSDSTIVLTGRRNGEIIFMKLDLSGNILASQLITPPAGMYLYQAKIINSVDPGFLIYGEMVDDHGFGNQLIIQLDQFGNIQWVKVYYDTGHSQWNLIRCDSGYAWYGANTAPILVKMDDAGNIQWSRKYNFVTTSSAGYAIAQTLDGGFILAGANDHPNWTEGFIFKTDSMGNYLWARGYGYPYNNLSAYNIFPQQDSSYSIVGFTDVISKYTTASVKIDSAGNINSMRTYKTWFPNLSGNFQAVQTREYGMMICTTGDDWDLGFLRLSLYLVKTDSLGNSGCYDTTATISSQALYPVQDTIMLSDSSVTLSTQSITFTMDSSFIVNTFCFSVEADELADHARFRIAVFPNPFHTETSFEIRNEELRSESYQLKIYNTLGALIREEEIPNIFTYTLHRDGLSDGLYFYELLTTDSELLGSGKFIVE